MNVSQNNKSRRSFGVILFRWACILLVLAVLTIFAISQAYAKYISSDNAGKSGGVAGVGIDVFKLMEHKADVGDGEYISGQKDRNVLYELSETEVIEVSETTYLALPGVDIPKDPFVLLQIKSEVSYDLYVKVTTDDNFPDTVTYSLTEDWVEDEDEPGLYKYSNTFEAGNEYGYTDQDGATIGGLKIDILKDNKIYVSHSYKGEAFSINFEAYLKQHIN